MSEQNVEIVRQVFDAVARRDTAAVLALYDPELEWDHTHGPFRQLMGGRAVYRGHDGLRAWFREWYDAWESVDAEIEELIDAGERVVSVLNYRGTGRVSGVEVEFTRMAGVWTIRAGRVVRAAWFGTRTEALEAAGVGE